jgi:hypothetical protein
MNNGRPSELGILEIADDAGNVIDKLNRLRLGPGLSLTRNDNDPSYVIDVIGNLLSSVVIVDNVASLRGMLLPPSVDKVYWTKNYSTSTDVGGMPYRWNSSDTTTDDGVLHLKNSFHSTGRFQPIKPPDGIMNAQACGPALADISSITRSFDPTGATFCSTEMYRITYLLRNSGWSVLFFGQDYVGNGSYKFQAECKIGGSVSPFIPFKVKFGSGAACIGDNPHAGIGVWALVEGGIPLFQYPTYYSPRDWTQTLLGAETSFAGVSNITGLSVNDWVLIRIGAEATDASGIAGGYFYAQIRSITPGSGSTGTITTWQCVPEKPPASVGINTHRTQTHHDMLKMIEFQDGTAFECEDIRNIFLAPVTTRNLSVDGVWSEMGFSCLDTFVDFDILVNKLVVEKMTDFQPGGGGALILASCRGCHVNSLVCNITGQDVSGGTSVFFEVLTEESSCRGTRIDFADITYNAAQASPNGTCLFGYQTPGQTDYISVGTLVLRGGYFTFLASNNVKFDVVDNKCGDNQGLSLRCDQMGTLIHRGNIYRTVRNRDMIITVPTSAGTTVYDMPMHGITRQLRIWPTTMTGIIHAYITYASGLLEFTSELTAGTWCNCNEASLLNVANNPGFNSLRMTIITDGTTPAGNFLYLDHEIFQVDVSQNVTTRTDDSVPGVIGSNGAPSANSGFIGQHCFDSTNSCWYRSVSVGSGAADWVLSGSNNVLDGTVVNGYVSMALRSAPSTPPTGKVYAWADSTTRNWTSKDSFGNVSVSSVPATAPAHNWFNSLGALGTFSYAQPSSADLSDLAPVALTNADATIAVGGGSYYALAAATLTGLHTLTLGNTGATDKQAIQVRVYSQGSNYLINDSAATLLLSVASGTKVVATFAWNTGTGKFQLQSWNFFT